MKVAIVHYWIVNWRGGEKILQYLLDIYPQADIFSHVVDRELVNEKLPGRTVRTTFIARLPLAKKLYQNYLPLMPLALEQLDLRGYDLVISCESGPAKGVIVDPDALHICYCHSPMRYAWDMYQDYLATAGWLKRLFIAPLLHYIRLWDYASAARVDHFIANSEFVRSRIRRYFRRDATVIHPPVALEDFLVSREDDGFYLIVGQLVPYKRSDLAVRTFVDLNLPLVVIGEGAQLKALRRIARGKANIRILGWQSSNVIRENFARCRALVFPGAEDFGMVPVEAMANGKPVIAYRKGGALETVVENVTGLFFDEQTTASLAATVREFEAKKDRFDPDVIRRHAEAFGVEKFKSAILRFVREARSENSPNQFKLTP